MTKEPMTKEQIAAAAADLQPALEKLQTYDEVQNVLLAKAQELKLTWPETRQFAEVVHQLKFGAKPDLKTAAPAAA